MTLPQSLIERCIKHDRHAFGQLYQQTADQVYRYIAWRYSLSKADIQDLVGDFYMKLWRVLDRYDSSYKFESFFWTVLKNMLKDYFKKKKEEFNSDTVEDYESTDPDQILKTLQKKYEIGAIKNAMEQLDDTSYQIIMMRYVEQREYDEISRTVNLDEPAVRKRLSRALSKIKELLK